MPGIPKCPPRLLITRLSCLRITDARDLGPDHQSPSSGTARCASMMPPHLSGVSVDLLSRLENGKGSVRLDKLLAVLDSLGLALVLGSQRASDACSPSRAPAIERPEQP